MAAHELRGMWNVNTVLLVSPFIKGIFKNLLENICMFLKAIAHIHEGSLLGKLLHGSVHGECQ